MRFNFLHLGFWSGNFFLIAPCPDHCLLVLFQTTEWATFWETKLALCSLCHDQ